MSEKKKVSKRIQPYISSTMARQLEAYCKARSLSAGSVVESALEEYFDDAKDIALLMRRIDRHDRKLGRLQRDMDAFLESFGVFVQLWFSHTPEVPEGQKASAKQQGYKRYQQYIDYVATQYAGGRRFIDELVEDLADFEELKQMEEENN